MNSQQEKIISDLTAHSMGADFVFAPNEYTKGIKGRREPADLVWACNNCIILMTMTESVATKEKMFQHNMRQLKGWLRFWKNGYSLKGNSHNTKYNISYDDYDFKILVSIVKGPNDSAEYHEELKRELATKGFLITSCVTIPEEVISYIASHGGSTIDLLDFIKSVKDIGKSLTSKEALNLIRNQHKRAFDNSDATLLCPNYETDKHLKHIIRLFRETRSNVHIKAENTKSIVKILNDLSWSKLIPILYSIRFLHEKISSVKVGNYGDRAGQFISISPPYLFFVSVVALDSNHKKMLVKQSKREDELITIYPKLYPVNLTFLLADSDGDFIIPMFSLFKPRKILSATENILVNW